MKEENPILLWSMKCYKQEASDKSDPHTMLHLHIFCVYSLYWYGILSGMVFTCGKLVLPCVIFHSPELYTGSAKMWSFNSSFFFPVER